jgi:hypothetical protein
VFVSVSYPVHNCKIHKLIRGVEGILGQCVTEFDYIYIYIYSFVLVLVLFCLVLWT